MIETVRENELLQWLEGNQGTGSLPNGSLGIGDDTAVIPVDGKLLVTTDLIAEGSHFLRETCSPYEIGRKALAVNLSDIAAMAGNPIAAFVSLLLPSCFSSEETKELMLGIGDLADAYGCAVAGGDTNSWSGGLAINVTLVGKASPKGPLLRSGAKPGDAILVTGSLGGSIHGKHLNFTPRVKEARFLHEQYSVHAAMDLSDGLAMDLSRMCRASGCGATVVASEIPISCVVQERSDSLEDRLEQALGDGEDFELLMAVPQSTADRLLQDQPLDVAITQVGRFDPGISVQLKKATGTVGMPKIGYEHGR